MNKKIAIFHGSGSSKNSYWIPWLKLKFERNKYDVWSPSFPSDKNGNVDLNSWVELVKTNTPSDNFDIVIGHSSGVPLILKLLSLGVIKANKIICVAGFMKPLANMKEEQSSYLKQFNIQNIKDNGSNFVFIHSDNDPWGCDIDQGNYMQQNLGGKLIIKKGEGHFGSDSFNQPYKEFPMLLDLCLTN